jgi:hypothetical protein
VNIRKGQRTIQTRALQAVSAAAVAASLVAVTACGSSSGNGEEKKTGPQVANDTAAALKGAGSARLQGTQTDGKTTASIDLTLVTDGATGTITQAGQVINLVNAGGSSYVKAPTAFYVAQGATAADAAKVADKWVKLPASSSDFSDFTLTKFAESIPKPDSGGKINDKVTKDKLDGKSVVVLSQTDGSKLYVATSGPAYPLKLVSSGDSKETATFTDFGKKVTVTAPAGAISVSG